MVSTSPLLNKLEQKMKDNDHTRMLASPFFAKRKNFSHNNHLTNLIELNTAFNFINATLFRVKWVEGGGYNDKNTSVYGVYTLGYLLPVATTSTSNVIDSC